MLTRRQLLVNTLRGSSLLALSTAVPGFVTATARAAPAGKEHVLVVLEMNGGNDGLNTVVPYKDEHYQKARPTLKLSAGELIRLDDSVGLHNALRPLERMLSNGQLAVVQGVGYPNPDRSHFESMDIWQSADLKRQIGTGWLGRALAGAKIAAGGIPAMHVGAERLPLALQGAATLAPTVHPQRPFELHLLEDDQPADPNRGIPPRPAGPPSPQRVARQQLLHDLAKPPDRPSDDLLQFVRRSSVQTYSALDRLRQVLNEDQRGDGRLRGPGGERLAADLGLVARLIRANFGTRVFYVRIDGFDTHADQRNAHPQLLTQIANAVSNFFQQLEQNKDAERVLLLTFSEFGRRLQENGSRGTDHGTASCLFVAGPSVKGGLVGTAPSLAPGDLEGGDPKHTVDFRQVYATLLDQWLGVDSRAVLSAKFDPVPLVKA